MSDLASSPQVTVLIAAYDAEGFVHRAIDSALAQSHPVLEVLVVDDRSNDDTVAAVRSRYATDARVRLVCLPSNEGPSAARNAGLDAALGEWVAILDADDAFVPDRIARLVAAARTLSADVVADNFAWFDRRLGEVGKPGLRNPTLELVSPNRFVARAMPYTGEADWGLLKPMFRKAFLDQHALRYPVRARHGEDYLLMIEVFLAGARYVLSPTLGYLYTDRSSGLSRTLVDYPGMAAESVRLAADPRIRLDPALARSMRKRAAAISRLQRDRAVRADLAQGRLGAVVRRAMREPAVALELARIARQGAHNRARSMLKSWLRR